ncbi:hypothetical protein [Staphylococcus equorum]|uniref:hypothetical protein n=1 Tax=Staphylococcus equorum TaxID=246432 RepID=UPI00398B7BDD
MIVLNGRKNNKIFELGKRNILLEYEIEQVLKNRKRLDSMSISKTQDKKMESDNFGVSKGPIK